MDRLKLKHAYHDALIASAEFRGDDVILTVDLCSCCNKNAGRVTLCFWSVTNAAAVREQLEAPLDVRLGCLDEIIGMRRNSDRSYVLDLAYRKTLRLEAKSLSEL